MKLSFKCDENFILEQRVRLERGCFTTIWKVNVADIRDTRRYS